MNHLLGTLIIHAPASALNNSNVAEDAQYNNETGVKQIRNGNERRPYVDGAAVKAWIRQTLAQDPEWAAHTSPTFRENKSAYTDGDPITYWDDDIFGYMRTQSKKASAEQRRKTSATHAALTETTRALARKTPFHMACLMSPPVQITKNFGVMTRFTDDSMPVPYANQLYRTNLQGSFDFELGNIGVFNYGAGTNPYSGLTINLDAVRVKLAQQLGLTHDERERTYRLPLEDRIDRLARVVNTFSHLDGGARQSTNYTDVTPSIIILTVSSSGHNVLYHAIDAIDSPRPVVKAALRENLIACKDQLLSGLYVGWVAGFCDDERDKMRALLDELKTEGITSTFGHPRTVLSQFISDLRDPANAAWMD